AREGCAICPSIGHRSCTTWRIEHRRLPGQAADGGGHEAILRPVVVLGDGAKWIWDEVAATFGGERTEIVDWWHSAEHLWDLSKTLHGNGTPEVTAWAETGQTPTVAARAAATASAAATHPRAECGGAQGAAARTRLFHHRR